MGNVNSIDRFQRSAVGSRGRIVDYTSKIGSNGDLEKIFDLNAILLSWNNILTTPLRTSSFDPEFGSNLYKCIFDPADDVTKEKVEEEIRYRLTMFDDRARITEINIQFLTNMKGFNVTIFVSYMNQHGQLSTTINQSLFANF